MVGCILSMSGRSDEPTPVPTEVPRLWTPREANERISDLGELLPQLKVWAGRLRQVRAELARLADFWGEELLATDHVDHEQKSRLEREDANLSSRLEEAVGALRSEGIEVKDLSTGLVDFYALEGGEVVLLCWRVGETEVGYFHTLTGGFAGRRPLPSRSISPAPD